MTKIAYVKRDFLQGFIDGKVSLDEFLGEFLDDHPLPGGLDHIDVFQRQVKLHCRGMNGLDINWIVRGY